MDRSLLDDSRLETLLAAAGIALTPAAVRALAAGAAAAPPGIEEDGWMVLLAPAPAIDAADGLRDALRALYRQAKAAEPAVASDAAARLAALRDHLAGRRLDGFVVPRADAYPGEYLPGAAERLAWLTGFTGSAGAAVILKEKAAVFVDGRYTLQVRKQVDGGLYEYRHLTDEPPAEWIAHHLRAGGRLGFDPWLHSAAQAATLRRACEKAGAELTAVADNPIDAIWADRPPMPLSPMVAHPLTVAGEPSEAKRRRMAEAMVRDGAASAFIAASESIAWLLNVRGGDVPFTPLTLAFAVLHEDATVDLYVDGRKVPAETRRHLGDGVRLREPAALASDLDRLGRDGRAVRLDRDNVPAWVWHRLERAGASLREGDDPCLLAKACKNAAELAGMRAAHRRDGAAMVRFLAWLDGAMAKGGVRESSAAARLETLRRAAGGYRGPSFETISGAGPNGAIVHYRGTAESDRELTPGTLYLIDSGGQYEDGTTDVTRTVAVGGPTAEMRRHFTLVLKGHIALATAVFPQGTSGSQLDVLARRPLWDDGLDYDHGTGHGVGSCLGVHEGPGRIAKRAGTVPLEGGMVLSDEPGYYREGAYGIRIENLLAVEARPGLGDGGRPFLGFEVLTLAPLDRGLVDVSQLTDGERRWVDAYHARVRAEIAPLLDPPAQAWLAAATRPLP
ncbi:aminopeptidase P family protein [Shumkonia mesophila]|uniref:aminopeptidase P family protein n=1 Tax=Shumkonia mesophila TaxID=2838854 RepID=UPI002935296E|nr:aminopeptidase P family protein [Shumkonia mesophila]